MKKTSGHTNSKYSKENKLIKEDLLHYVWATKAFSQKNLKTTSGKEIVIHSFGTHNHNAGPDFLNAKITIEQTLWVGNVEMHTFSSNWDKHRHSFDEAYKNVILHVVFFEDCEIFNDAKNPIPCLELQQRISPNLIVRYKRLKAKKAWIPCEKNISDIDPVIIHSMIDVVILERLESKVNEIEKYIDPSNMDLEQVFFILLARSFGLKVNTMGFEELSKRTHLRILAKYRNQIHQIEALLFGQAGFLQHSHKDTYAQNLKREYTILRELHDLSPVPFGYWNFLRLRPAHFPTIRIAQLAQLIHKYSNLFDVFLNTDSLKAYYRIFDFEVSNYWQNHYLFGKKSTLRKKRPGSQFITTVILNAVVPMLFYFGRTRFREDYVQKALFLLKEMKPERNSILDSWINLGLDVKSALDGQALLHLKNHYCDYKRCLECKIGHECIKPRKNNL